MGASGSFRLGNSGNLTSPGILSNSISGREVSAGSSGAMNMKFGDHFHVPYASGSVKVGLGWDHNSSAGAQQHTDVDASAVLLNSTGKKVDHVSFGRKTTRDHTVIHTGDEKGHDREGDDESIIMHLDRVNKEVQIIMVLLNVYTASKTLDDVSEILARVVQLEKRSGGFAGFERSYTPPDGSGIGPAPSKFMETNELCKYKFLPTRTKLRGIVFITFQRRVGAQAGEAQWKVIATGHPVAGRSHRHVTTECESLAGKFGKGWLPVAKGYRTGGEIDSSDKLRARAHQMRRRSTVLAALPEDEIILFSGREEDNEDNENQRRSSTGSSALDTMTPDDFAEACSKKRSRVIRKAKRVYSVGRGGKGCSTKFDPDEDEDDSGQDEELFLTFFPGYGNPSMMRYGNRCYNTGTEKDQLLAHYMRHQAAFRSQEAILAERRQKLLLQEQQQADKPIDDSSSSEDEETKQRKALELGASGVDAEGNPLPSMVEMSDAAPASNILGGSILKPQSKVGDQGQDADSGNSPLDSNISGSGPQPPPGGAARPSTGRGGRGGRGTTSRPLTAGNSKPRPPLGSLAGASGGFGGDPAWLKVAQTKYQNSAGKIPAAVPPKKNLGATRGRGRGRGAGGARPATAGSPKAHLNLNHLLSGDLKKWVTALLVKEEEKKVVPSRSNGRLSVSSHASSGDERERSMTLPLSPQSPKSKGANTSSRNSRAAGGSNKATSSVTAGAGTSSSNRTAAPVSPEGALWDNPLWPPQDPFLKDDDNTALPQQQQSRDNSVATLSVTPGSEPPKKNSSGGAVPQITVAQPTSKRPSEVRTKQQVSK